MREGFDHARGLPHPLVFSDNHPNFSLRGKAKGAGAVLRERGLWPVNGWRSDGFKFKLECPKKPRKDRPAGTDASGCDPKMDGTTGCCARRVLSQQQDFREQKGQLQEEVEAANHLIIFYPKFHCELNFIERFWCAAKWYARENCAYSFEGLRQTVPAALESVTTASINRYYGHCARVIDAYSEGFKYGTKSFTARVYKGHRQVVDKTKW